jgi:hypothetical protein
MTVIRIALVPTWQRMPPREFQEWFRDNERRIGGLMRPLGALATVSAVASALRDRRPASSIAAGSALGVAAITLAVNEPANRRFAGADGLTDEETIRVLDRWTRWHNARVALGVVGAGAAIHALGERAR